LDSVEPVLLVAASVILAFYFIAAPICLFVITRRTGQMNATAQGLSERLETLEHTLNKEADRNVEALGELRKAATNQFAAAAKATHEELKRGSDALSSYAPLLVTIKDLYAAIQHFEARIRDGAMMADNLGNAIAGFHAIIKEGGQAAADVNGIMAEMRRDQKALSDSHVKMLETLQQQQQAFDKILGQAQVQVRVELDYRVTETLNNVADELRAATRVIAGLEEPLSTISRPKPPRGLLARIFIPD
jgi:hypothetical protein